MNYILIVIGVVLSFISLPNFPKNMRAALKMIGVDERMKIAERYRIICSKCGITRDYDECFEKGPDNLPNYKVPVSCRNYLRAPGPRTGEAGFCNTPLLILVSLGRGKAKYMPMTSKKFCYPGIVTQLELLLDRPDIREVTYFFPQNHFRFIPNILSGALALSGS
jgi:hypothetical protein